MLLSETLWANLSALCNRHPFAQCAHPIPLCPLLVKMVINFKKRATLY
jgi:hypothetical protein